LVYIHYRKFTGAGHIVSTPNMVCVTTLPCNIVITTLPVLAIATYGTPTNIPLSKPNPDPNSN